MRFFSILIASIIFIWVGLLFVSTYLSEDFRNIVYNLSGIFVVVLVLGLAFAIEKRSTNKINNKK